MRKVASAPRSVNGEIALVQRKNRLNLLADGKINQGSIGELRADILVPFHERRDCFGLCSGQRQQLEKPAIDAAQQLLNCPRRVSQKPGCLGNHRPARKQWPGHIPKSASRKHRDTRLRGRESQPADQCPPGSASFALSEAFKVTAIRAQILRRAAHAADQALPPPPGHRPN